MIKITPLEFGKFYHIYNRGINSCNLFEDKSNYGYFLKLFNKYIDTIADTYAWCLMPNHFHFLIRVKEKDEIGYYKTMHPNSDGSCDSVRFQVTFDLSEFGEPERVKKPNPTKHFSHLFNAYAKYYNKKHNRHGSLFERPFRRKLVTNENYLKHLVYYIHRNPIHHGFSNDMSKYPWSSYPAILSSKKTKLKRNQVIEWFDDLSNFKFFHKQPHELQKLKDVLID